MRVEAFLPEVINSGPYFVVLSSDDVQRDSGEKESELRMNARREEVDIIASIKRWGSR